MATLSRLERNIKETTPPKEYLSAHDLVLCEGNEDFVYCATKIVSRMFIEFPELGSKIFDRTSAMTDWNRGSTLIVSWYSCTVGKAETADCWTYKGLRRRYESVGVEYDVRVLSNRSRAETNIM